MENKPNKISQIDNHRPHVVVQGLKSVHVIPVACLDKMAAGELKVVDVEDIDDFLPTIIGEWLVGLSGR